MSTGPLVPSLPQTPEKGSGDNKKDKGTNVSILGSREPTYTPLNFVLQGTLKCSHLHIWMDMNMLVHNIAASRSRRNQRNLLQDMWLRVRHTQSPSLMPPIYSETRNHHQIRKRRRKPTLPFQKQHASPGLQATA